ncbi:hypothetical protein HZB02_02000 [Candidatus Woesearchaeota archaeon]|nr:hypothetical protein [Candidatus Woesearchaeota archaeon]
MESDESFFKRCADRAPFLIFEDTLYQISDTPREDQFLQLGKGRFGLVPTATISQLETFYETLFRTENFDAAQEFIKDEVKNHMKSRQDRTAQKEKVAAATFILKEFFPLLIDTTEELGKTLGIPLPEKDQRTGKQIIDDLLNERTAAMEQHGNEYVIQTIITDIMKKHGLDAGEERRKTADMPERSLWDMVTERNPVFVYNHEVFYLDTKPEQACIVINGNAYGLKRIGSTQKLEQAYTKVLERERRRQALEEYRDQIGEMIQGMKAGNIAIEELMQEETFSYGNIGYIRRDGAFYGYFEIPKFAMQNPLNHKEYHPFPATKVSVKIEASDSKVYVDDGSYIINAMVHPFLRNL